MAGGHGDNIMLFLPILACGEAAITGTLVDAFVTLGVAVSAIVIDAAVTGAPALDFFSTPLGCLLATAVSLVVPPSKISTPNSGPARVRWPRRQCSKSGGASPARSTT